MHEIQVGRRAGNDQTVGSAIDCNRELLPRIWNGGQFSTRDIDLLLHHAAASGIDQIDRLPWFQHQQILSLIKSKEILQQGRHGRGICVLEFEDPHVLRADRRLIEIANHVNEKAH